VRPGKSVRSRRRSGEDRVVERGAGARLDRRGVGGQVPATSHVEPGDDVLGRPLGELFPIDEYIKIVF